MKVVELSNVGRKFIKKDSDVGFPGENLNEQFWALKNIDMHVFEGEIIGIIGRNGSGKTTLLRVISGIIPATEGNINIKGKVSSLLTLGSGFQDELSGKENIFLNGSLLGLNKHQTENKFKDIVNFSELGDFINEPLGSYSDGMKMRLGFGIAINIGFDILAVDEVIMVGDVSFQKKCFNKLLEFKKQNKTLIISTQSMDAIERLCDRVILLEGGRINFIGEVKEGIDRYYKLLNQKKFLERTLRTNLVLDTKKWATDVEDWGLKEGTKEVKITSVELFNGWGKVRNIFKSNDKLRIKVNFNAYNQIENYHFGIALFREDGVYCYGPNTKFDGYKLDRMHKGKGFFSLGYEKLNLCLGIYYLTVAVWDEHEKFAYDYHKCCYKFKVTGGSCNNQLLNLNYQLKPTIVSLFKNNNYLSLVDINYLHDKWGREERSDVVQVNYVLLLDRSGFKKDTFFTDRYMNIKINFDIKNKILDSDLLLWVGIFRSDGIYCHGVARRISNKDSIISLTYPHLELLPGKYNISLGFWSKNKKSFISYKHGIIPFKVAFTKKDHGTVYLKHRWEWKLPRRNAVNA